VSANYPNFVETVQDCFNEEDLCEVYVEINFNKLIFTGYNDANSELSEAQESKCYSRESSLLHEGNSCTSFFWGKNKFKWAAEVRCQSITSSFFILACGLQPQSIH
jgi:hypothetical protein